MHRLRAKQVAGAGRDDADRDAGARPSREHTTRTVPSPPAATTTSAPAATAARAIDAPASSIVVSNHNGSSQPAARAASPTFGLERVGVVDLDRVEDDRERATVLGHRRQRPLLDRVWRQPAPARRPRPDTTAISEPTSQPGDRVGRDSARR